MEQFKFKEKHILSLGFSRGPKDIFYKPLKSSIFGGEVKEGEIRLLAIEFNPKINLVVIHAITSYGKTHQSHPVYEGVVHDIKEFKSILKTLNR